MNEFIGKKEIKINNKFIKFSEPIRFVEEFKESSPELLVFLCLLGGRDVRFEPLNNIYAYNKNGEHIWSIKSD